MNFADIPLTPILAVLIAVCVIIVCYNLNTKYASKEYRYKYSIKGKRINKKILKHYYEAGLNDKDIEFFRQTMATALKQINKIESLSDKNSTLTNINKDLNLSQLLHSFFKEIVNKPSKLDIASEFLYKDLPTLTKLYMKYVEIDSYLYKDKDTDRVLKISIEAIYNAYEKINEEYRKFISDDLSELNDTANTF